MKLLYYEKKLLSSKAPHYLQHRFLVDPPHYGSIGCQIFKSEGIKSERFLNQVYLDFLYNGGVPTKLTIILVYFVFLFWKNPLSLS